MVLSLQTQMRCSRLSIADEDRAYFGQNSTFFFFLIKERTDAPVSTELFYPTAFQPWLDTGRQRINDRGFRYFALAPAKWKEAG